VLFSASYISDVVDSQCSLCPLTHLRLLNAADNSAYSGSEAALDANNNLVVQTSTPFSALSLLLEAFMDPSTQADCQFIDSQQVSLSLEVCGTETVVVENEAWPYKQDLKVRWNETVNDIVQP